MVSCDVDLFEQYLTEMRNKNSLSMNKQAVVYKRMASINTMKLSKSDKNGLNCHIAGNKDREKNISISKSSFFLTCSHECSSKSYDYSLQQIDLHKRNRQSRKRGNHFSLNMTLDDRMLLDARKNTFQYWPLQIGKWWPAMLAEAGFFYLGRELDLQCDECKVTTSVKDWKEGEKPEQAHARINPRCKYVILKGYKPKPDVNGYRIDTDLNRSNISTKPQICIEKQKDRPPIHSNVEQDGHGRSSFTALNFNVDRTINNIANPHLSNGIQGTPDNPLRLYKQTENNSHKDVNTMHLNGSIQSVVESMNSQLTIDASNSRVEEQEYKYPQYQSYLARQRSYVNWKFSQKQTPDDLSIAGYFYTGENDIVRCFCCDLGLAEWDPKDDPWTEHARHNPKCLFLIRQRGTLFIENIQKDWKKIYNPKHAAFDDKESRIATFDEWRKDIEQTPEILAEAGFFNTGEEDVVRCHYCDGGLRHWEPGDVPWEEHARWFPFCKFLIKMKGREYIEEIKQKTMERQRTESAFTTLPAVSDLPDDIKELQPIKDLQIMDIDDENITYAVMEFRQRKGHSNFTTAELTTLIFDRNEQQLPPSESQFHVSAFVNKEKPAEKDPQKIKETNRQLKDKMKCIRCRTNDICMLFVNCGHRQTCEECADLMDFCPICDTRIKKRMKTYLS